jgi:hypothetical protein
MPWNVLRTIVTGRQPTNDLAVSSASWSSPPLSSRRLIHAPQA